MIDLILEISPKHNVSRFFWIAILDVMFKLFYNLVNFPAHRVHFHPEEILFVSDFPHSQTHAHSLSLVTSLPSPQSPLALSLSLPSRAQTPRTCLTTSKLGVGRSVASSVEFWPFRALAVACASTPGGLRVDRHTTVDRIVGSSVGV